MVDFLNTNAGKEFASHIKTIALNTKSNKSTGDKIEDLAQRIYVQIVALDFFEPDGGLDYEFLKKKAQEAAENYFK